MTTYLLVRDTIFGGSGNDKIFQNVQSSPGIDRSLVRDESKDYINCGGGNDEVWVNTLDKDSAVNCEIVHKGAVVSKTN